jgi:hypothetical protein
MIEMNTKEFLNALSFLKDTNFGYYEVLISYPPHHVVAVLLKTESYCGKTFAEMIELREKRLLIDL